MFERSILMLAVLCLSAPLVPAQQPDQAVPAAATESPTRLHLVALKHAPASRLAPIVQELLAAKSKAAITVTADERTNSLLVLAPEQSEDHLRLVVRIAELVFTDSEADTEAESEVADPRLPTRAKPLQAVEPKLRFAAICLEFAEARGAARCLQTLMKPLSRRGVTIVPDLRTNSLLVAATDEDINQIKEIVSVLDVEK